MFLLLSACHRVLEAGHEHFFVNVCNGLLDQLLVIKLHRIGVLVMDQIPQTFELCLVEIIIERVLHHRRLASVSDHAIQCMRIENTADQGVHPVTDVLDGFRQRDERIRFLIISVLVGDMPVIVYVVIANEIIVYAASLFFTDRYILAIQYQRLADKILCGRLGGTVVEILSNTALQIRDELLVPVGGDDRQMVHPLHLAAQNMDVLSIAVLIDTQPQPASDLLSLLRGTAAAVFQRTDLEHIGIVPALAECRVRKDKPHGIFKGEQSFLVLHNEIVGRNIGTFVALRKL